MTKSRAVRPPQGKHPSWTPFPPERGRDAVARRALVHLHHSAEGMLGERLRLIEVSGVDRRDQPVLGPVDDRQPFLDRADRDTPTTADERPRRCRAVSLGTSVRTVAEPGSRTVTEPSGCTCASTVPAWDSKTRRPGQPLVLTGGRDRAEGALRVIAGPARIGAIGSSRSWRKSSSTSRWTRIRSVAVHAWPVRPRRLRPRRSGPRERGPHSTQPGKRCGHRARTAGEREGWWCVAAPRPPHRSR